MLHANIKNNSNLIPTRLEPKLYLCKSTLFPTYYQYIYLDFDNLKRAHNFLQLLYYREYL